MNPDPHAPNKQRMKKGGLWIGLLCFPILLLVLFSVFDKSTPGLSGTYATLDRARRDGDVCEYYDSAEYVFTVDEKDLDFVVDFIICEDDFVIFGHTEGRQRLSSAYTENNGDISACPESIRNDSPSL